MGDITIHLPADVESGIESLISRGIYKEKEDAIIGLIRAGLFALKKREVPGVRPVPEYPPIPPVKPPENWPNHYEFRE